MALLFAQLGVGALATNPIDSTVAVPVVEQAPEPVAARDDEDSVAVLVSPVREAVELREIDPVTITFTAGAALDERARADLEGALEILTGPDAAPVLIEGHALPGPDEDAALLLATERAEAVRQELIARGAPGQLLRTTAAVDPDAGRSVVLGPDVP